MATTAGTGVVVVEDSTTGAGVDVLVVAVVPSALSALSSLVVLSVLVVLVVISVLVVLVVVVVLIVLVVVVSSSGHQVVSVLMISVTTLPKGQSVTVGWQDVMVYVFVIKTVAVAVAVATIGEGVLDIEVVDVVELDHFVEVGGSESHGVVIDVVVDDVVVVVSSSGQYVV